MSNSHSIEEKEILEKLIQAYDFGGVDYSSNFIYWFLPDGSIEEIRTQDFYKEAYGMTIPISMSRKDVLAFIAKTEKDKAFIRKQLKHVLRYLEPLELSGNLPTGMATLNGLKEALKLLED